MRDRSALPGRSLITPSPGRAESSPLARALRGLRRPALAPHAHIVQRSAGELQVGLDPRHAVVVTGVGAAQLLTALDGTQGWDGIRAAAGAAGLDAAQVDAAALALTRAGLIVDRAEQPAVPRLAARSVRLLGAGEVGRRIGRLLVRSGVGTLYVFDEQGPQVMLASLARETSGTSVIGVGHWSKPESTPVDLTVIASDSAEVDRVILRHLARSDQSHLLVRSTDTLVTVGPLVIPGQTSCVRCADLARRDADPSWPSVLSQLTRIRSAPIAALAAWAASIAAVQALAQLHGELPETAGATLELGWPDLAMQLRAWPAHPACGCGWTAPTEWAP